MEICYGYLRGLFLIATVLPLSQLVLGSFFEVFGIYDWQALTLHHFRTIFHDPQVWQSIKNSFLLASAAALLTMLLSFGVAYVVTKTSFALRKTLDLISWVPWTVPGLVLSLGMLWAHIRLAYPFEIYGTLWILLIAFITNGIPLGVRLANGGLAQISDELEESAWVHGATWLYAFRTITLKLMAPVFFAGTLILFVTFMRALGPVILLYGHGTELLSITIFHLWQRGEPGTVCALSMVLLAIFLIALGAARLMGATGVHDQR